MMSLLLRFLRLSKRFRRPIIAAAVFVVVLGLIVRCYQIYHIGKVRFVGFRLQLDEATVDYFAIRNAIEKAINEQFELTALEIPVVVENLTDHQIQINDVSSRIETVFSRYYAGTGTFDDWFRFNVTFDRGPARFSVPGNDEPITRPTVASGFRGSLLLGGKQGNYSSVRAGPSEARIKNYLIERQELLNGRIQEEEQKQEKTIVELLLSQKQTGRPPVWFTNVREKRQSERIRYCWKEEGRSITKGDNRQFLVGNKPPDTGKEDKDLIEVRAGCNNVGRRRSSEQCKSDIHEPVRC